MSAKYLVTVAPGVPVAGIGFVRVNDAFTAPAGFIPSRTFKPLNAEASAELEKLKATLLNEAKKSKAWPQNHKLFAAHQERAESLEAQAASIDAGIFELPVEEKKVERDVAAPAPAKSGRKL
jgi:hypothetical protein